MSDFLNRHSVLVLNSLFQAIGTLTPKKALIALNSESDQNNVVARTIDVVYKLNEDGSLNLNELDYWQPLNFEEWLMVEPRPGIDKIVHSQRFDLRSPTVIVTNYSKMPMRKFKISKSLLYERQGGRCGYTNEVIPIKKGNIEHKIAKSKNGKHEWNNVMFVKEEINSRRGNRDLSELGLKPLFTHSEPRPIPACNTIKSCVHPDWQWFVSV